MDNVIKENSENVAPPEQQSPLKHTGEVKEEKPSGTEAISGHQKTGKEGEQTSTGDEGHRTRQVRVRRQVQRFSETMSKRYADEQAAKEKAHDAVAAQLAKGSGTPLGEIPLIEASIRKSKPVDLRTLHLACFGRFVPVSEVRSNLRKFSGFTFDRESEEYGKREQALNKKSVKEIQNALRQLHLEVSGTRPQLASRLLEFLLKPAADAVKYKGKLPTSKRKSTVGRKSLPKKEEEGKKGVVTTKKPKVSMNEGGTESDELGDLSDDEEREEEEEAEQLDEDLEDEEDEEEEESGKSDVDYAPGKRISKKRKSSTMAKKGKSPRKAKRRRKQVVMSEEEDEEEEEEEIDDGGNSSPEEVVDDDEEETEIEKVKTEVEGIIDETKVEELEKGNSVENKEGTTEDATVFPTDEELKSKVFEILKTANLNEVSMKVVRESISEQYKDVDLSAKKQFINDVIKEAPAPPQPDVAYHAIDSSGKRKRWYQTLALSPWFYISSVGFLTALIVGIYFFTQSKLKPIDLDCLEVSKCPACFGQSACPAFFRGDVRLATFYGSRPIHASDFENLDGLISVDLGTLERRPAALRHLQWPVTTEAVDAEVCRRQRTEDVPEGSFRPRCVPHLSIWRWMATTGAGTSDPIDVKLIRSMGAFTRCASSRLLQLIQSRFRERSSNPNLPTQSRWLRFDELTLLFNLAINPHAVISTTFPASEAWPFPVQLGACGRMTLETGTVKSLSHFVHAPVKQRLSILKSLLQIPSDLTSSSSRRNAESSDFVLYLGDYRWDVFGVDIFTYRVNIIQARHLMAVDLREPFESASPFIIESNASYILQDSCHDSPFASKVSCLSEEHSERLCANNLPSDHNYWAICMTAMHNGRLLVRDMPPDLVFSLEKCLQDAQSGARQAHVEAALEIIDLELAI